MVNTNIQATIPLVGKGLTSKPYGNYQSGEFVTCLNLDVADSSIISRVPLGPLSGANSTSGFYQYGQFLGVPIQGGFVGEDQSYGMTLVSTTNELLAITNPDSNQAAKYLWSPSSLPKDAGANSYHVVVGFFEYNKKVYWITEQFNDAANTLTLFLYYKNADGNYTDFNSLSSVTISSKPNVTNFEEYYTHKYKSFFIFKERLYVVTNNAIYFSKATDPTVWASPDGGFLVVPDSRETCAVGLGDSIYIGTEDKLNVFTYPSDPNSDGWMRTISTNGLTNLIIVNDQIFGCNRQSFYQISNTSVQKIFDFEDVHKDFRFEDNEGVLLRGLPNGKMYFMPIVTANYGQSHAYNGIPYVFDIYTGFMSQYTFNMKSRSTDLVGPSCRGVGHHVRTNTNLFFMNDYAAGGSNKGLIYTQANYKKLSKDSLIPTRGMDAAYDLSVGDLRYYPVAVDLEIRDYCPDGSEHLTKKFRNLLLEGQFPQQNFKLYVGYNDQDPTLDRTIVSAGNAESRRPPYAIRVGLNQRSNSISFRLKNEEIYTPVESDTLSLFFALSDFRILWTYTNRPRQGTDSPTTTLNA